MVTIDGLALPAPTALTVSYDSVGRSAVTADGSLVADRLAVKRRAKLVWRGLERADTARTLTALTQGTFLAVTLPDPRLGDVASLTMTLSRLDTEVLTVDGDARPGVCQQVTAVLTER